MHAWLLTNTPSPYQSELFRAIHNDGRCRLDVRMLRAAHRGKVCELNNAGFPCKVLNGFGPSLWSDAFRYHPEAVREIKAGQHDLYVFSGQYTSLTFMAGARTASRLKRRWTVWLEQPWPDDYRPDWSANLSARSALIGRLRRKLLAMVVRNASAVWGIGTAAADAYIELGAAPEKARVLPYYCDTHKFSAIDNYVRARLRGKLGIQDKTVFLYSGQLIPRKGVEFLLDAFERAFPSESQAALLLLGDGPMRGTVEHYAKPGRIISAGHVAQSRLPEYFAAADVFVFPSRHDGWGVVLNEACAAGLPIIAAKSAGATRDLVLDGRNGFALERDDKPAWIGAMRSFVDNPDKITQFGAESRQVAEKITLKAGVERFVQCCKK